MHAQDRPPTFSPPTPVANAPVANAPAAAPTGTPTVPAVAPPVAAPARPARGESTDRIAVTDEAVSGMSVRRGTAETVINAPMEYVVRTMLDYPRYSEFMPHVHESRVVRRNRAQTDIYLQVPLTAALGVVWTLMRLTVTQTRDRVELVGQAMDGNTDHFDTRSVIERIPDRRPGRGLRSRCWRSRGCRFRRRCSRARCATRRGRWPTTSRIAPSGPTR